MRVTVADDVDLLRLEAVAATFGAALQPGTVVTLSGPLGAGKTTFIAAAVRALNGSDDASSPTFTFWHRYAGTPPVHHLDLYRVEGPADLATLGLEEAFVPEAVVFVEWPERAPGLVPGDAIAVTLAGSGNSPRRIEIATP
jgi:tRNA threonylcarbamoyl adenosine modification protein YjeE